MNADGLPYNHAFSILDAIELKTASGNTVRLVEIRNPWGESTFEGRWSDTSSLWTEELKAKAIELTGHTFGDDDGEFFMQFEDFV